MYRSCFSSYERLGKLQDSIELNLDQFMNILSLMELPTHCSHKVHRLMVSCMHQRNGAS